MLVSLQANQQTEITGTIGDGSHAAKDVDVYKVSLVAGQTLKIDVDAEYTDDGSYLSSLDSYLRVFNSSGSPLASNSSGSSANDSSYGGYGGYGPAPDSYLVFQAPGTGDYYIGVSGESYDYYYGGTSGNHDYDPNVPGSGQSSSTGAYRIQLESDTPAGPSLTVADGSTSEDGGSISFLVSLSEAVAHTVSFNYLTSDGTAVAPFDYSTTGGSIDFQPGELLKTIVVPVIDDSVINEANYETFTLTLSNVSGVVVADGIAVGTIVNNDFPIGDAAGDHLAAAMSVSLQANQQSEFTGTIDDGNHAGKDIDLYRVSLVAGQTLKVDVDAEYTDDGQYLSSLDSYLRIFNSSGLQLATNSHGTSANDSSYGGYGGYGPAPDSYLLFEAPGTGDYFIGVSGETYDYYYGGTSGNHNYDPNVPGSGQSSSTGAYRLQLLSNLEVDGGETGSTPQTSPTPIVLVENTISVESDSGTGRIVQFAGKVSGPATSIELDIDLDQSADISVLIQSDLTFSVLFSEPDSGLASINYVLVPPDSGASSWQSLEVFLPPPINEPSVGGVSLVAERLVGEPDNVMSGFEGVRGDIAGAASFDFVSLELDYQGDEFADVYFDVTGLQSFDVNVIQGAMNDMGSARLALTDYATGNVHYTQWVSVATVTIDHPDDEPGDGNSGQSNVGNDGNGTDPTNDQPPSNPDTGQLAQAVLAASANPLSPTVTLASTISTSGNGRMIIWGVVNDATIGTKLTAYRIANGTISIIGDLSSEEEGSTVFRIVASGQLNVGEQVVLHQHRGDGELGAVSLHFTVPPETDGDFDGISEAIESAANGGDGNNDGIPDSQQASVATLIESVAGAITTFDAGTATLVGVSNFIPSDQTVAAFVPQGLYSFAVHGVTVGSVHSIDVYLHSDDDFGVWMKQDPTTGEMNDFLFDGETGAIKTEFGFTLYIKDGGRGDDDGVANGIIIDPSGPSFGVGGDLSIGYWPSSPFLYVPTVVSLPGVPSGLDSGDDSGGYNSTIPAAIQASMASAYGTYQSEVATHNSDYNLEVATAQSAYDSARTSAAATYNGEVTSATNAYSSASEGFVPADLQSLQDDLTDAEQAYQVAYDSAMQSISERGETESMAIMNAQYTRDANAEEAFQDASNAIREAAYENAESEEDIDWDAVNADISAAQKTRDDAIIESATMAAVQSAALSKSLADEAADAGKSEYEAVLDAGKELQKAAIDNDYDYKDEMITAIAVMQRTLAAANSNYTKAMADAKEALDSALATALKNRAKADNASSTTYSKQLATLQYDAVVANESGVTSRASTFRLAVAASARDLQHAQLDAEKSRRDSYLDADDTLEGVIASVTAQQTKDQADATQAYNEAMADAKESFNNDFYTKKRSDSKDVADDQTNSTKAFDGIGRSYTKSIAGVNQVRSTRYAEELEDNQKAQALASNQYQNGVIDQSSYQSQSASLATEAANKRRDIAKETFGSPPAPDSEGNLPAPGPDEDPTEARASMERFVSGSSVSRSASDASASRSSGFSSSLKGWSQTFESAAEGASDVRGEDNDTARDVAETGMGLAMKAWTAAIATAEAGYTSSMASAYSAYNVAIATAVVAYEKGLAQDRSDAISTYSTDNPDNIWAKYEAAKAAAELARTNAVADAYAGYVGATSPAEATLTSNVATRQAAYLNAEIDAATAYEGDIVSSTNTYQADMRSAESSADGSRRGAISTYDGSVSSANIDLQEAANDANLARDSGNMLALLTSLYERIYLPQETVVQNKRDAEASAGAAFASAMINANKAHRGEIADANEQRAKDLAEASDTFVTASGNASGNHQKRMADAAKAYQDTVADEAKSSQQDIADYSHSYQTTLIDADETYTKAVADANAIHSKAMADAWAAFEKDFAVAQHAAASVWAGDGVSDPITRYEQYVIDVYAARSTWTSDSADATKANQHANADANKDFVHAAATASATQQRDKADAAKTINRAGATINNTFEKDVIAARTTETKDRADAVALGIDQSATANGSFGSDLAGKIRSYRSNTLNASGSAASSTANAEEAYHRDRDDAAREIAMAEVGKNMEIAMASAESGRASAIAGIINTWGSGLASAFVTQATDESAAVQSRVNTIAAAWKSATDDSDSESEAYASAIRGADATYNSDVQAAVEAFVAATGTAYVTATEALGNANQALASAVAGAEATYHIGSQSDLVDAMLASYGPIYNPYEAWEIRVARGQLTYLTDFAPEYIAYAEAAAENAADRADAMAVATTSYENSIEAAVTQYVNATGAAFTSSADSAGGDQLDFYSTSTTAAVNHADTNASANHTSAVANAGTNSDYSVDRLKAETAYYRDQAEQGYIRAQERNGETPTTPSSDDFLDDYNEALANAIYGLSTGSTNAGADYRASMIGADKAYIDSIADAQATVAGAIAGRNQTLTDAYAAAAHAYRLAAADAQQTRDKAVADSDRNGHVSSASDHTDALLAHYAAVKTVMLTFASVPHDGVQQTVAYAIANDAWAQELGPKYVTQQTTIADAAKDYTYATVDAIRAAVEEFSNAQKAYAEASSADEAAAASDRANALKDAIKSNASARQGYDSASNDAGRAYSLRIAEIRRDAQIDAGYYGDPTPDAGDMADALADKTTAMQTASDALTTAMTTAVSDYFTATNEHSKQSQIDSADNGHAYATDVADAVKDLDQAFNDAYRDYDKAVIDANADYAIAEVDANVTWLNAVRAAYTNGTTTAAHAAAVANRAALIAQINADRSAALAAADTAHSDQVTAIDDAHADAITAASGQRDSMIDYANEMYDDAMAYGPGWMILPYLEAPDHFGGGVSTGFGLTTEIEDITSSLSFGDGGGAYQVGFPGGFGGLYNEITTFMVAPHHVLQEMIYQNPSAAGHLALDVIGLIPFFGIFADSINAAWYAIEGDWVNAGLSAAAAVPGLGYGAIAIKYSCGLMRATRFADIAANVGGSAVGMIEGGYAVSADPSSAGGYLQIGLGAMGLGINARAASKGFGGCFDAGTLVHVPVDAAAVHDAVWSDNEFFDPGFPHPASGTRAGGKRLSSTSASDWWRTGGTPPAYTPSSGSEWLDRHVQTQPTTTTIPIEQIRLGQRVIGENPEPFDVDPDFTDPVQENTRRIAATVLKEDGTAVDVEMLRPASFVDALGLVPGSELPLHLAELDVKGIAAVTEVTTCPTIQQGDGQVVTARFITRHAENRVRVTLSNGTEFIATDVHPVWTPENHQWTPAGELTEGTLVDTLDGEVAVQNVEPLSDAAAVYNIEVNGHHVYRVANVGVLVHNNYANNAAFGPNTAPPRRGDMDNGYHGPNRPIQDVIDRAVDTGNPQGRWTSATAARRAASWVDMNAGPQHIPLNPGEGLEIIPLPNGSGVLIRDATQALAIPRGNVVHIFPVGPNHVIH